MYALKHTLLAYAIAALAGTTICAAPSSASEAAATNFPPAAEHRSGTGLHADLMDFLLQQVFDPEQFTGKRIAIIAGEGASAFELELTRDYFMDRGARVDVLTPRPTDRLTVIGLAAHARRFELIPTLDYANQKRWVAANGYLDQVRAEDYDTVFLPNNLRDAGGLRTSAAVGRFLLAAQLASRPIFCVENSKLVVDSVRIPVRAQRVLSGQSGQVWSVFTARDAFDLPRLIGAMVSVLTTKMVALK